MALFTKIRKAAGWMSVSLQPEGVVAACIMRDRSARPIVEQAAFYPCTADNQAEALAAAAKDMHAGRWRCSNLLHAGEYQLLTVEAPNVPPDELKTAIRWRLKDMLDFHIDDATIDVAAIPADKAGQARGRQMHAVAARNHLIESRQSLLQQAKIPLEVIDIPEMAQRNIAVLLEPEGRAMAMLSFDNSGGLLTITHAGELYLSRRIDVSVDQLAGPHIDDSNNPMDRVTLELQRSLDHFDRQFNYLALSKLMLSPLPGNAKRLKEHLSSNLYVPVEDLNLDSVLDMERVPALASEQNRLLFMGVLGAALRVEEKAL